MSHFSVLIIGDDIEGQLAPFQENNMGDCPKQYLAFHDQEDEFLKEYETEGTEMVRCEDGTLAYSWDERFRVKSEAGGIFASATHEVPPHLTKENVPHKTRFTMFEQFCSDWHSSEERDPEKGRFGYWENPNAKWDWYSVGGRWTGFFKLKVGAVGALGRPGLMTPPADDDRADELHKGDIDFGSMRSEAAKKAHVEYDFAMGFMKDLPPNETFEAVRAEIGEGKHDEARIAYWAQPRCAAWHSEETRARGKDVNDWPFSVFGNPDAFLVSREKYVESAMNREGVTLAVIKDGKWFERGSMGWWGVVSDEKDRETWNSMYWNLLQSLPDDTKLTIVDCHI